MEEDAKAAAAEKTGKAKVEEDPKATNAEAETKTKAKVEEDAKATDTVGNIVPMADGIARQV